jgi:hypothetical protein
MSPQSSVIHLGVHQYLECARNGASFALVPPDVRDFSPLTFEGDLVRIRAS